MIGNVTKNATSGKFELAVNGKVLARSSNRDYFEYHIARGDVPKLQGVTQVVYDGAPSPLVAISPLPVAVAATLPTGKTQVELFSVNERFDMIESFVEMAVAGHTNAVLIAGEGGVGKSYAVTSTLKRLGKKSTDEARDEHAKSPKPVIEANDSDDELEEKVEALAFEPTGDYVVVKGFSTDKALYETLYNNNGSTIIFDDCDSVLRSADAINVLKGALDTTDERWVSWNSTSMSGVPNRFMFTGQVIFITNLPLSRIDDAIRTRCFNIDVSMTTAQAMERMEFVLPFISPEVDMTLKREAFDALSEFLYLVNRVSYRTLIKMIQLRVNAPADRWKNMAKFSLVSNG